VDTSGGEQAPLRRGWWGLPGGFSISAPSGHFTSQERRHLPVYKIRGAA
jgi:hypothetical protein